MGSEPASGALTGTESAMAAVTLFTGSIISPKFEIAYASGIHNVTQPDKKSDFDSYHREAGGGADRVSSVVGRAEAGARHDEGRRIETSSREAPT